MTSHVRVWLVVGLLALAVGCAKQPDQPEFKTYSELEKSRPDPSPTAQEQERPATVEPPGRASVSVPAVEAKPETAPPAVAESARPRETPKTEVSTLRPEPIANSQPLLVMTDLPPAVAEKQVREITLLVPDKQFETVGPEGALRVSYDDVDLLKVLNMEPVPVNCADHFPDWLKALDGQRIRIRGFMYPPFQETDLPFFVLARDNAICCMGRDPKRYDVIDVEMRDGVTTDYIQNRPFDVVGVLRIRPEASRGVLYQLYLIEDAVVVK
jgi:hypothetical protein